MKSVIFPLVIGFGLILGAYPKQFKPGRYQRTGDFSRQSENAILKFERFWKEKGFLKRGLKSVGEKPGLKPKTGFELQELVFDTTFALAPSNGEEDFADVIFDGSNFFVVWIESEEGGIFGARVSPEGTLIDTLGIPLGSSALFPEYPAVVFDGTNYFVVWTDWRNGDEDIYGTRVSLDGEVLDPDGIPISVEVESQVAPSVIFDGRNYLVAWNDLRSGNEESDIYAARVTTDGEVLDPDGIAVNTHPYDQIIYRGLGFDGTNYLFVISDDRDGDYFYDAYGMRMDTTGVVLDSEGFVISAEDNDQAQPRVVFDGTNYFVVWCDDREERWDYRIYGARVTPMGVVLDSQGIRLNESLSLYPALAFDGTNYFVVWTDLRSDLYGDIYGTRVSTTGTVLDSAGIPISSMPEYEQVLPAVIFGNRYFVFWSDGRNGHQAPDIYGARVDTTGQVLDPEGILMTWGIVSAVQYVPVAAFDGTNYLVVWSDYRNGSDGDIYGARVTPSGEVLDPGGIPITTCWSTQYSPAIAFDGTNYLVVWSDYRNGSDGDIYGARVTPSGEVLDPDGIPIAVSEYDDLYPKVGFNGENYLIGYEFHDWTGDKHDIYGVRVAPDGNVLGTVTIAGFDGVQIYPAVSPSAETLFAVWQDDRAGGEYDIYGARVTPSGEVLDPEGIPICTVERDQVFPTVAYSGGDGYFVVWDDSRGGEWSYDIYGARVSPDGVVLDSLGVAICTANNEQFAPQVGFLNSFWLVAWDDYRNQGDGDIFGARVTTAGQVLDPEGVELVNQPYDRYLSGIAAGMGQVLLTFDGFVPDYFTNKALGAFWTGVGIAEQGPVRTSRTGLGLLNSPVRNQLVLMVSMAQTSRVKLELMDITGRQVRLLKTGELGAGTTRMNFDLRGLNAGVYFLKLSTGSGTTVKQRLTLVK